MFQNNHTQPTSPAPAYALEFVHVTRVLPACAYGVEHVLFVDDGILTIQAVNLLTITHYTMSQFDTQLECLLEQHTFAADQEVAFHTGAFIQGLPHFYFPPTKASFISTDPNWRTTYDDVLPVQLFPPNGGIVDGST